MPPSTDWASLPSDLHLAVQLLLPLEDRCRSRAVCRAWRASADGHPQLWRQAEWRQPVLQRSAGSRRRFYRWLACLGWQAAHGLAELHIAAIHDLEEEWSNAVAEKIRNIVTNPKHWQRLAAAATAAAPRLTTAQLRIPGTLPSCGWLEGLQQLQSLELAFAGAPLQELMASVASLQQLQEFRLTLEDDHSRLAPACYVQPTDPLPPHLHRLYLTSCVYERHGGLPTALSTLGSLTRLELESNHFESYTPLPAPPNLRALSLAFSLVRELPDDLTCLVALTELNLALNGDLIQDELEVLSHLTYLQHLTVGLRNASGPKAAFLGKLPRLAHLDLSDGNPGYLTAGLSWLGQLTTLKTSWHQFVDPPENILAACTNLRVLHMWSGWQLNFQPPTGAELAALLRALCMLPMLSEVAIPLGYHRPPGQADAEAALAELRAAKPALVILDEPGWLNDAEPGEHGEEDAGSSDDGDGENSDDE